MSQSASGGGQAFNAGVDAVDGPAGGDDGVRIENDPYRENVHVQLRAVAEHAELSVELAERQIADLQEAMEGRRAHAQEAADELRAYEDRHDVHQTNRSTNPQE
jgi:hypothetical protein